LKEEKRIDLGGHFLLYGTGYLYRALIVERYGYDIELGGFMVLKAREASCINTLQQKCTCCSGMSEQQLMEGEKNHILRAFSPRMHMVPMTAYSPGLIRLILPRTYSMMAYQA
jgi:hypothetical protein